MFEESHSQAEHDAYHSHGHSHDHQHDDSVTSVAFTVDGDMDLDKVAPQELPPPSGSPDLAATGPSTLILIP